MNDSFSGVRLDLQQQWQNMNWISKCLSGLIFFILLVAGFFTSMFIFSTWLIVGGALWLSTLAYQYTEPDKQMSSEL